MADGRGTGVRTADGRTVAAAEAVIVSTTPDLLYGRLLREYPGVPSGVRVQAAAFQHRRGCFQVNLALSARPHFTDRRLDVGGCLNLGRGVEALVTSVRQAGAGLLPEHPSISWHEPTAVDPGRAPAGRAVVRMQVLDVPHTPVGDAAGTGLGGHGWDASTAEAFADRVLAEAEPRVPGLTGLVLERHITTPADLARSNPNAGPGDHAAGDNSLTQGFTQRPIPAHRGGYRTAVPGVWLIGPATWPAAGISGASGRAVARELTGPSRDAGKLEDQATYGRCTPGWPPTARSRSGNLLRRGPPWQGGRLWDRAVPVLTTRPRPCCACPRGHSVRARAGLSGVRARDLKCRRRLARKQVAKRPAPDLTSPPRPGPGARANVKLRYPGDR